MIQSGSLARNTHICPFRRIAMPSRPKAQCPLYYSKQIQRAVEGMCMASGKSLQTTSDRANMRFHLAQIRNHVLDDVREGIGNSYSL